MAIEYKLSYTAAQIDERLGMVDDMVKTVNGVAPDNQGNVQIVIPDSSQNVNTVEPAEDDIPKVFFSGDNSGMSKDIEKVLQFAYKSRTANFGGYVKMKWQGSSTLSFPKKNFTIKMFEDEACGTKLKKAFKRWGLEKNKYVLKADYIDHTHARNIVTANLWSEMVECRPDFDSLPDGMKNAPGHGAIDGFPIKLYLNGVYQGIYTWTIGKEDWMFGMDETDANNAALCAEKNNNGNATTDRNILACEFRGNANIDGNDWDLEFPETLNANIKTSFNNLINCVKDTDDATFKATIGNRLDLTSAFDYYILAYLSANVDGLAKNLIMLTYDGVKWFCSAYDMDNIWGSRGTSSFVDATLPCPEDYYDDNSLLWQRIEKCFGAELYARYLEVRKTVLNFENVIDKFERFCDLIGSELYAEDVEIYSGIPFPDQNNLKQIRSFFAPRAEYVDTCMAEIGTPTVTVPCTGISLSASELNFSGAGSQTLTATVEPDGCTDAITWESTDHTIASVAGGVVTAKANGSATITAKCGEYSASCAVSVSGIESGTVGTEGEYIADGLVTHLDARDVQTGDTTWKSRVDGAEFTMSGFSEGSIGENYVKFNGSQTVEREQAVSVENGATIEYLVYVGSNKACNRIFCQSNDITTGGIATGHATGWGNGYGFFCDTIGNAKLFSASGSEYRSFRTVAITLEPDGTKKIYIDGVLSCSVVTIAPVDFTSLIVGYKSNFTNEGFEGRLYSFRVYDRALSDAEIQHNYETDYTVFGVHGELTVEDPINEVYKLTANTVFGSAEDAVNTNEMLWDEDKTFAIAFDMTPNYTEPAERTVFATNHISGHYQGIKFTATKAESGYYLLSIFDSTGTKTINTKIPNSCNTNVKCVIRHVIGFGGYELWYIYNGNVYSEMVSAGFLSNTIPLWIGGDNGWTGTVVRPWAGTMHSFTVYDGWMTNDEINAYLKA